MMENVLIVSCTEKNTALFTEMLDEISVNRITIIKSSREARQMITEHDFDLVIIISPLDDESGENLSRHIISQCWAQVILAVKKEDFAPAAAACEGDGVMVISQPVNGEIFRSALSLARSAGNRIRRMQTENIQLKQKIEDIRVIDRAKCLLISYLNLTEQEAHRFIEKQAMDLRSSKRTIAEGVLKTYAN